MEEKKPKPERTRIISKGKAYLYLKGLMEESEVFEQKVKDLRKDLDIELPEPASNETPQRDNILNMSEDDLDKWDIPTQRELNGLKKLDIYSRLPQLTNNEKFINLCKDYYIPTKFWPTLEIFVYTGDSKKLLNNKLKIVTTLGKTAKIQKRKFMIPHAVFYIPIDISKDQFVASWEDIEPILKFSKKNWFMANEWKSAGTFDRAMASYKISKEFRNPSQKLFIEELKKTKYYSGRSLVDMKEVYREIRRIEAQIVSLNNLDKLMY